MSPGGSRAIRVAAIAAGAFLVLLVGLVLFFPAGSLRGPFERRVSQATGYTVTVGGLKLGLSGFGFALNVSDLLAVSADGAQTLRAPRATMRVALMPLLKRRIVLTGASVDEAVLEIGPATREAPEPGAAEGSGAASGDGAGGFVAPEIRVRNSRIVHRGSNGVTTFHGVLMDGSFKLGQEEGGGASVGRFDGKFGADSTWFAPASTPNRPLVLPNLAADFESVIRFNPRSATTSLDGKWGDWPGKGTIESAFDPELKGWRNSGVFDLDRIDLERLDPFLAGAGPAIRSYELGGSMNSGRLRFETVPGHEEMDYDFTTRLEKVQASLPGKGRVVENGSADVHVRPDNVNLTGAFDIGRAKLDLDAHVTKFAAPEWQAAVRLAGPAEEILRFVPAEKMPDASGGSIDLDLKLAGRFGEKGLPQATGTVRVERMTMRHPSIAVPIDQLDLTLALTWNAARIDGGFVQAGRSAMRFTGTIPDLKAPDVQLVVSAGTIDLDQLLPKKEGDAGDAAAPPGGAPVALPVSGRISIDTLVRDRLTLTDLAGRFAMTSEGIEIRDMAGKAYGGSLSGDLTLSPAGSGVWTYGGEFALIEAHVDQVLAALTPIRGLEGRIRTRFNLSGRNGPGIDVKQALSMTGGGIVRDGSLVNIPLVQKVSQVLKFKEGAAERIDFRTLRHRLKVENGFALLDTMRVTQDGAEWDLAGRIGLDGTLDCPVVARIDPTMFREGTDFRTAAELLAGDDGRLALAFRLGGTIKNPDVQIDLSPLVEAATQRGTDALREELKKRLGGLLRRN